MGFPNNEFNQSKKAELLDAYMTNQFKNVQLIRFSQFTRDFTSGEVSMECVMGLPDGSMCETTLALSPKATHQIAAILDGQENKE